jgi:hypothetical protein
VQPTRVGDPTLCDYHGRLIAARFGLGARNQLKHVTQLCDFGRFCAGSFAVRINSWQANELLTVPDHAGEQSLVERNAGPRRVAINQSVET